MQPVATHGLCKTCVREVPATRFYKDGKVWITKICPEHGSHTALREPISAFDIALRNIYRPAVTAQRSSMTFINVNHQCNMRCPGCYHSPDILTPEPGRQSIIDLCKTIMTDGIAFLGAEPTVHSDLPGLIRDVTAATGKPVSIVSNGLRLTDEPYVRKLKGAGLHSVAMTLRYGDYVTDKAFEMKKDAVHTLLYNGVKLWHLAFSIKTLEGVSQAIDDIDHVLGNTSIETNIRLRVNEAMGFDDGTGLYLSDLAAEFGKQLHERNRVGIPSCVSNPYMLVLAVNQRPWCLVHWPSIDSIDLGDLADCPSKGLLVPEIGLRSTMQHGLVFGHLRHVEAMSPREEVSEHGC